MSKLCNAIIAKVNLYIYIYIFIVVGHCDSLSRLPEDLQALRWHLSGDVHPWQG